MRFLVVLLLAVLSASGGLAAEARSFSGSLTPAQKERLGLSGLTAVQWAELDALVGAHARGETAIAVQQAEKQSEQKVREVRQETEVKVQEARQQAAAAAVADYRKKEEPGVIARTLEVFKRKQAEEKQQAERFAAKVVGPFRGWSGGTYFPLENGQVWRQVGSESYELPVVAGAEVEIFQSNNGYWRLRYDGAWITVKRVQ